MPKFKLSIRTRHKALIDQDVVALALGRAKSKQLDLTRLAFNPTCLVGRALKHMNLWAHKVQVVMVF